LQLISWLYIKNNNLTIGDTVYPAVRFLFLINFKMICQHSYVEFTTRKQGGWGRRVMHDEARKRKKVTKNSGFNKELPLVEEPCLYQKAGSGGSEQKLLKGN
jgi:hypothetical protein